MFFCYILLFCIILILIFFLPSIHLNFSLNSPEETAVERSATARALPAGYPHKPVFPTRPYPPWSTAPITIPGQARSIGVGGFFTPTDSPPGSPAGSPLKSSRPLSSPSRACPTTIKATLGTSPPAPALSSPVKSVTEIPSSSPIRSYRTVPSPIKTVVQQGQYPIQSPASFLTSGSIPATDPVSIKNLASVYTSRTTPIHSIPNCSLSDRSSAPTPFAAPPKMLSSVYSSNLPFKTALGSTVVTEAVAATLSSVKSISSLASLKTSVDSTLSSRRGGPCVLSLSTGQATIAGSDFSTMNGSTSPVKYLSSSSTPSSPTSRLLSERSSSLQERIQATTQAATSGVSAAINEAIDSYSVSGFGTLKSLSSSRRSTTSSSAYGSLRSTAASPSSAVSSNTMTVPVYSLVNVIPETPVKPGPGSLKMALPDSPRASSFSSSCVTGTKLKSQLKSPPFITPPLIHPTAASNQEILKDVADMKEDLIRMTAILQTDTQTAAKTVQTSHIGTPKEAKLEDEEPYTLVEKVKKDLVKVSEILQKDMTEGKAIATKEKASEQEWEEFSKDEIEEAQRSTFPNYYPSLDEDGLFNHQSLSSKLKLAEVVDFLTNDIGASSLSRMADLKSRFEAELKTDGEEKQKRVLKPSMSVQENKLKMPPPVSGMLRSPSEKDLSKLAESYQGSDTILESPEDLSHEQDKSPLSDSGFETRSEKTPSAPQSAESTEPKPLFTDSPIPPCVTETRTEVVHIRSYEQPDDLCEPGLMEEAASALPAVELEAATANALQMKMSEDDALMNKSMCLKEETHITTTTRMVYHKPQLTDGTEMIEEAMSVRDIMKAFQSGRDPSKDLAGLFEHKASQDSVKGDELTPRFLDRDSKSKPKVERIIEVHIEKGHSAAEPTEVIIRETKKHPEVYIYKGDRGIKELTDYDEAQQEEEELTAEESLPSFLETSRVNTPVSQEEDSRPSSAQLIADDSYKALKLLSQHSIEYCDDELSEVRGESYRYAEKMLLSEKIDPSLQSYSDTEELAAVTDKKRRLVSEETGSTEFPNQQQGSPKREFVSKSSKDGSPKSSKFLHKDEPSQFDKVTVLHYSTEQGSPKHAVWMRFTEDKHDKSRDKLLYEDRVDQTVKEAEEKLSEVSQFFRDKTEKLNDELQSPEKKPVKRELREPRSWPSSVCSSPEKTKQKPKTGDEGFSKSRLGEPSVGKIYGTSTVAEKKSYSLPSSPQKTVVYKTSEDKLKQEPKASASEPLSPDRVKATSKVSAVKMKFESVAQKDNQSQGSPTKIPPPVQPKPSIKKLQESKLPVFSGGKASKVTETSEDGHKKNIEKHTECTKPDQIPTSKILKVDKLPNRNLTEVSQQIGETKTEKANAKAKDTSSCATQESKNSNKIQVKAHNLYESDSKQHQQATKSANSSKEIKDELPKKDAEGSLNKNLRKKTESHIPVRTTYLHLDDDLTKKETLTKPSQIPILSKTKSLETSPAKTNLTFEILDNAPKDSNSNNLLSPREILEKVITPSAPVTTKENFKGMKTLPVYVQVGRQAEREAKGALYNVKQKSNSILSPISPDDDTLEQVSFIDSSGKSPLTPETPSSEEVSYDLTCKTPDGFMGFISEQPSPIMEVSEESDEDGQGNTIFSFKEAPTKSRTSVDDTQADLVNANKKEIDNQQELTNNLNKETVTSMHEEIKEQEQHKVSKDKGVAYIEFPPPPPLDSASENSDPERKGSCASSETETEMMDVNLQEEHDKHLRTEPIIRIQPPSPVHPGTDDSQSNADDADEEDESIFQPIPCKKLISKISAEEEEEKEEQEKPLKAKRHDRNGSKDHGGTNGSSNGSKGSNGQGEDNECEQNGNDQSITDCSIATTAEFSHDTDATEIDSLDGYDLQDEDDGLYEQAESLRLIGLPDSRKDVWATDSFRSSDRPFPQSKLEVIEEEKIPEECQKDTLKKDAALNNGKADCMSKDRAQSQEQKQSDKEGFSDSYFSYKLEEFNSPFKTVATKGLDFDPWPSRGGEGEVIDMGGTQENNSEPKPYGLAVEDQSQATTAETTPAQTPTDDSTPTSDPNPFPFHEGKMFEMTRSGAIDMSKRDMVEERLQFFQIGEHHYSAGRYRVRDFEVDASPQHTDQFNVQYNLSVPQVTIESTTVKISNVTGGYSTCRDSASKTEPKFSTFRTGSKLSPDKKVDASNSVNKYGAPSTFDCCNDKFSGQAVDRFYCLSSDYAGYCNCNTSNTVDDSSIRPFVMDPNDSICLGTTKQSLKNQNTYYQSTDYSSAPLKQCSIVQTLSSNTSIIPDTQSNISQVGSIEFNLLSSRPTHQEVSKKEVPFIQVEENLNKDRTVSNVAITSTEVKGHIFKSKLPLRAPSFKLCSPRQPAMKDKAQENVDKISIRKIEPQHKFKKRLDPFIGLFPKSQIPIIKAIVYPFHPQEHKVVGNKSAVTNKGNKSARDNKVQTKIKSSPVKTSAVVSKNLKTRSGNSHVAITLGKTIWKEAETKLAGNGQSIEDQEHCGLVRAKNTSLSELSKASRSSRPSCTSTSTSTSTTTTSTPSTRDVNAEVEQASSERMRTSTRKSRRTLGKKAREQKDEGSQVDQPITTPVMENKTSL